MYTSVRAIHLLLASFSLPFLLMYGVSAVQMSHNTWFQLKPTVTERQFALAAGTRDGRAVARQLMDRERGVRGEIAGVQETPAGFTLRIALPGTVHDVQYERASGAVRVKTSVAGAMGMLNRLHHAAGLWHEPAALQAWGVAVAIVSLSLLIVGATGLYMWFARRQERLVGAVLLCVNLVFTIVMLALMRAGGP
jgi:hypothetical protein